MILHLIDRKRRHLRIGAMIFLIAPGVVTAASAGDASSSLIPAEIDRACTADMHLSRDSLDYKSCTAILGGVQIELHQQRLLRQARADCSAAGLAPGSREFAECTLANLPYRVGRVDIDGR
jgi:hypothetical protein